MSVVTPARLRLRRLALALCLLGAVLCACAAGDELVTTAEGRRARRVVRRLQLSTPSERLADVLNEYTRRGLGSAVPFTLPQDLTLKAGSVSVLILPVPVPVPSSDCAANNNQRDRPLTFDLSQTFNQAPAPPAPHEQPEPPAVSIPRPFSRPPPKYDAPTYQPGPAVHVQHDYPSDQDYNAINYSTAPPPPPPEYKPSEPDAPPPRPSRPRPRPRPPVEERENAPLLGPVEDSALLVEQFRAQQPADPGVPPVLIEPVQAARAEDELFAEAELPVESPARDTAAPAERKCTRPLTEHEELEVGPPLPRFERSLYLRARLTVPRADYTEPYELWWDAASGSSRVDFHGGTTSSYRMMRPDGRVQSAQIRVDRSGDNGEVRRCVVSGARRVTLAERALPALPDLSGFAFSGHVLTRAGRRLERWRQTVSGHSGQLGGVRGEALSFRHELLVARAPDNYTTVPLRYSVEVDSSVLGANCDGYVHHYTELSHRNHEPSLFHLEVGDACETVDSTDRMELIEPLREYTQLARDPAHDDNYERFKKTYNRRYADDAEEAVRKTTLIQTTRYQASGNRQGASFELGVNYLSDRLVVELERMLGALETPGSAQGGEPFPHSDDELKSLRGRLPAKFDWRERGGVSEVRNQWQCSCCWAIAVAGAVEGALFKATGRLVPLSEQALIDCAKPYGGNGCNGTWPRSAYNYIQDNGLPTFEEYPLKAKVEQCKKDRVESVTRISGFANVTMDNVVALKVAIMRHGPTVVIVDGLTTPSFATYKKSYYYDGRCKKNSPNHAVLAVGWTTRKSTGETYFILKNSWSTAWGEAGYMRLRAPTNTCGVLRRASYPRLARADVQRVPAAATAAAPRL